MDQVYPFKRLFAFVCVFILTATANAQGLVFKNASLQSGKAGAIGAVYKFSQVSPNVDALVEITDRSSSKVKLVNIDLSNMGWDKAFQPQVTYDNNTTPNGTTDYWMEFDISFISSVTKLPVIVSNVDLTAIDIDGNGSRIAEWVSLYSLKSYTAEKKTLLDILNLNDLLLGLPQKLLGKKFKGPVSNFTNIDTSATNVMVSAKYENTSQFRIRTGATSNGSSSAADRMYSFWFKSFGYEAPVTGTLPVRLSSFTARLVDQKVVLNWTSEMEKNVSHFTIERSVNGTDYSDAGIVFTDGNSTTQRNYSFTDDLKSVSAPVVYYRLKMVDLDGFFERSQVRVIRQSQEKGGTGVTILAFPNPVVNELRVTMPMGWQDKAVTIDVFNANGQVMKHLVKSKVGQIETVRMSDLPVGLYIVKASNGSETATQRIVKSK
jgi:hypothetical protein